MLGNNIKLLRQSKSLSQRELARLSKIPRSTLNEIENEVNGGKNPRLNSLIKLCVALRVTPNELIPEKYWKQ